VLNRAVGYRIRFTGLIVVDGLLSCEAEMQTLDVVDRWGKVTGCRSLRIPAGAYSLCMANLG
jgi:hypothetical protein